MNLYNMNRRSKKTLKEGMAKNFKDLLNPNVDIFKYIFGKFYNYDNEYLMFINYPKEGDEYFSINIVRKSDEDSVKEIRDYMTSDSLDLNHIKNIEIKTSIFDICDVSIPNLKDNLDNLEDYLKFYEFSKKILEVRDTLVEEANKVSEKIDNLNRRY